MATVPTLQAPNIELPKVDVPRIELSTFDPSTVDLAAIVSEAAEAVGLRKPARRSRWIALGLILAAGAGWGLLRSPQVRARSRQLLSSIRERISNMRPNAFDLDVGGTTDPIAFPAAKTKAIAPDRWTDATDEVSPDYPEGLGSDIGEGSTTRDEAGAEPNSR
jgi:hypothetical protein